MVDLDTAIEISSDIAKKYPIERLGIFGSYATGKYNFDSDIDFVFALNDKIINHSWDYLGFLVELEDALNKSVDLINIVQLYSEKDSDIHGDFRNAVLKQMRWIYESQS